MRQFKLLGLLALFLFVTATFAQEEAAEGGAEEGSEDEMKEEECEEAWEYVEFLKAKLKNPIEEILQDTLFQPKDLLDLTVHDTVDKVLEIRDAVLERTKAIRTGEGNITICKEQNINQEEFLTQMRMQIMAILLELIEKDVATAERLQDIGKQLLAIRSKANSEITRMIMLRETKALPKTRSNDACDCGILNPLNDRLEELVNKDDKSRKGDEGEQGEEGTEEGEQTEEGGEEGEEGGEGGDDMESPINEMNMILMDVDAEIEKLYKEILITLDDEPRAELSTKLQNIKAISIEMHEVMSELVEEQMNNNTEAVGRIVRRDVRGIYNDVKRLLAQCLQSCPGECESCGARKIDEIADKLTDFKANLEDLEEAEAMETIRAETMTFLTTTNNEMTDLLTKKAESEDGILEECDAQLLEVIDKIKGPLWMMVNITIFGDGNTMTEMIGALEAALTEIRLGYCGAENVTEPIARIEQSNCFLDEIDTAKRFIISIDDIISQDLFKGGEGDSRKQAMLDIIKLKSDMDKRVKELFQDNLQCKEEVEQIKNVYAGMLTSCLAELMNPRYNFKNTPRAQRVACIKGLRISIEERRGELLMREIELRIQEAGTQAEGEGEA